MCGKYDTTVLILYMDKFRSGACYCLTASNAGLPGQLIFGLGGDMLATGRVGVLLYFFFHLQFTFDG